MTHRAISLPLAGLLATLLAGCAGISDPYRTPASKPSRSATTSTSTSSTSTTTTTTTTTATTTASADAGDPPPERGGSIPAGAQAAQHKLAADAGSPSPRAAIERYARLYVNWQSSTLAARQRELASISLGQARAQALQAAASAAQDPELTKSQVADHGQLIALSPGTGAAAGEWVLITREHTTGQGDYTGLPPTVHVTYAQLTHTPNGWVISGWQPQN
jgi:hypothetical protein